MDSKQVKLARAKIHSDGWNAPPSFALKLFHMIFMIEIYDSMKRLRNPSPKIIHKKGGEALFSC